MDIEKLGLFYLGKQVDQASGKLTEVPVLYDAADLVTHAVCVDPDPKLAQRARERGWSILALHRDRASASA